MHNLILINDSEVISRCDSLNIIIIMKINYHFSIEGKTSILAHTMLSTNGVRHSLGSDCLWNLLIFSLGLLFKEQYVQYRKSPDFRLENNLRDPQTLSSPFLPPQDNDDSSQPATFWQVPIMCWAPFLESQWWQAHRVPDLTGLKCSKWGRPTMTK